MTIGEFNALVRRSHNSPELQEFLKIAVARVERTAFLAGREHCTSKSPDGLPCTRDGDHDSSVLDHVFFFDDGTRMLWGPLAFAHGL